VLVAGLAAVPIALALVAGSPSPSVTLSAGSPSATPWIPSQSLDARGLAQSALVERAITCFREVDVLKRPFTSDELRALTDAATAVGGPGHWLVPGGDPWASGQGWVGPLDSAANDLGGTLLSESGGGWIVLASEPAAIEFTETRLPNGMPLFTRNDWIRAAPGC